MSEFPFIRWDIGLFFCHEEYCALMRFFVIRFLLMQFKDGIVLPDKASLYLTAIEDAEYKDDKIECKFCTFDCWCIFRLPLPQLVLSNSD